MRDVEALRQLALGQVSREQFSVNLGALERNVGIFYSRIELGLFLGVLALHFWIRRKTFSQESPRP